MSAALQSHAARYRAEAALALGGFAIGTTEFVIMGLINVVAQDLGVATEDVGYAISSYALGVVVGAPLLALLGARLPRKTLLIGLMLLFAVGNIASALATRFDLFVLLRFIAGLPHGAYFGIAALVAANAVLPDQRARAVARVMTGLTVAILIGAPLGTWAGFEFGWPVAFIGVGVCALLTALLVAFTLPNSPPDPDASPAQELRALVNQRVLMTLALVAFGCGGLFAVFSYVVPTLELQAGMPESAGPWVLAIFGFGTLLGMLGGARLADWNLMRAIPLILIGVVAVQALFYWTANLLWLALPHVALIGASIALGPAVQTRLMDVAGPAQTMAASLHHAAFNLANALGAWLAGEAIRAGAVWSSSGLVGAALGLVGLLLFFLDRWLERRQRC